MDTPPAPPSPLGVPPPPVRVAAPPLLSILSTLEWIAAVAITLAALHLHFVFLRHAGPLWRDEVSSIDLANLPGFRPLWETLTHDSFPLLWSLVLRFWDTIGLGDSDMHLRWLGLLMGSLLLASIWICARLMSRRVPLLALALLACSATTIWSGDSLRAYGLGTSLAILTLGVLWRFSRHPTLPNGLMAATTALLSAQCLYQNAFLLLAAGLSAAFMCAIEKKWRAAGVILFIGLLAALSLLPYLPQIVRSQDWWILEKSGFYPDQLWRKVSQAIGFPLHWFDLVWVALVALAAAAAGAQFFRARTGEVNSSSGVTLFFAVLSLILGIAGFGLFLKLAALPTQPWYYLSIMGFAALCLDQVFSQINWTRPFILLFAVATTAFSHQAALPILQQRQSNLDRLAEQLAREAGPNDFIVVNDWYCGVTFQRYYHGPTPWMTLPPLADLSIHRYDLVKAEMQKADAIRPLLDQSTEALRAGYRVWLLGRIPLDGQPPPAMKPAPNNPWGWLAFPYTQVWQAEFGYFISQHASNAERFPAASDVNPLENVEIAAVSGWRE